MSNTTILDPSIQIFLNVFGTLLVAFGCVGLLALYLDYRAGVFVEVSVCESCAFEPSLPDSIFCVECDAVANDSMVYCRNCGDTINVVDPCSCFY